MIIYKITNTINNKIYIGQTIRTLKERIIGYRTEVKFSKKPRIITYAMRKYGFENFSFEVIDSAKTKEELDNKEKYYIRLYDSTNHNYGYNMELGGNGAGKHSELTKQKISKAQIGSLNHMYGKTGYNNPTSKEIIDLTTGIRYGSAMEAGKKLDLSFSHIAAVARGERGSTGQRVFRYIVNNEIVQPEHVADIKQKCIIEKVLPEYKKLVYSK